MFEFLNQELNIQLLGIIFDIIGAFYLSRAFIFKKSEEIKNETYGNSSLDTPIDFGMSGNLFFSFYSQGIEARIGFLLLFIGFLFQGAGVIWPLAILPVYIILIVLIISFVICECVRNYLTNFDRIKAIHDRNKCG